MLAVDSGSMSFENCTLYGSLMFLRQILILEDICIIETTPLCPQLKLRPKLNRLFYHDKPVLQ